MRAEALRFERLEDRPGALDLVARWWFDEWGRRRSGATVENLRAGLRASLGAVLPVTVLAVAEDAVVGVAELKAHEVVDRFPERSPWLGGVYVDPARRGDGVGPALVREIERLARAAAWHRLWLQTERLDGGLYARLDWRLAERVEREHGVVRIMVRDLADVADLAVSPPPDLPLPRDPPGRSPAR